METILKSDWIRIITPLIITIFCGLCYNLYAQQNKMIEKKAEKAKVDALCTKVEGKVDNATLVQMIKVLELKDSNQDRRLAKTEKAVEEHSRVQYEQLKVLQKIQLEMQQLNRKE